MATERFVIEYLAAAPASKLHCFGGDVPIARHLSLARAGLSRALATAVQLDVLAAEELPVMARMLLHDNALAVVSSASASPWPRVA